MRLNISQKMVTEQDRLMSENANEFFLDSEFSL